MNNIIIPQVHIGYGYYEMIAIEAHGQVPSWLSSSHIRQVQVE